MTQFYGVTDITNTISDNSVVGINTFATVTLNDDTVVSMRIVNVLTDYHVGEQVGWVKGKPYYKVIYHIHRGRKMVGAKHISRLHDYIYDTKEASLNNVGEFDAAVATSGDTSYSNSISGATNIVSSTSSSSSGSSGGGSSGGSSGSKWRFLWRRRRWIRLLNK